MTGNNNRWSRAEHRFDFSILENKLRDPEHSDIEFARQIGIGRDKLRYYRKKGITFYAADRLCISLGYHPSQIWGEEYWNPTRVRTSERNKQEAQ